MVINCKAKGTRLENEFKQYFEKWGYLVTRAAGSFGIDLIGLKFNCPPLLVNVKWKRVYCGPSERKELIDDASKIGGLAVLAYKHVEKGKKNGKHCIEILNGPKEIQSNPVVLEPLNHLPSPADAIEILKARWNPNQ